MRSQYFNGKSRMLPTGRVANTNDLGEFRIFGLAPGRYYLSAMYRNMSGGDSDDRAGYGPITIRALELGQAQRIVIAAGETIAGA